MKPLLSANSILIVGAWNLAIFQPDWVKTKVVEGLQPRVSLKPDGLARLEFVGQRVSMAIEPGKLEFRPMEDGLEFMVEAEQLAVMTLEALPETPIVAMGINFGFEINETEQLCQFGDSAVYEAERLEPNGFTVQRKFKLDDHFVNVFIERQPTGQSTMVLNTHFDVKGSAGVASKTLKGSVQRAHEVVGRLTKELNDLC